MLTGSLKIIVSRFQVCFNCWLLIALSLLKRFLFKYDVAVDDDADDVR